jgi:hypothetical protein
MSWEDYEKRIASIFRTEEVPDVTGATLQRYRGYLVEHLDQGLKLTGREDFPWEERYVLDHVDSDGGQQPFLWQVGY